MLIQCLVKQGGSSANEIEFIMSRYTRKTNGWYLLDYYKTNSIIEYNFNSALSGNTINGTHISFTQNAHKQIVDVSGGWYLYVVPDAYFTTAGIDHLTPYVYDCGQNGHHERDDAYMRKTQLYIASKEPIEWVNQ